MPIVMEKYAGQSGGVEAGGRGNEGLTREWERRFEVWLDNRGQGTTHALLATGIPRIGDPYVQSDGKIIDLWSLCHSVKADRKDDEPRLFVVVAQYSTRPEDFGDPAKETPNREGKDRKDPNQPDSKADDPLQQPAEIEWGEGQYSEIVTKANLVTGPNVEVLDQPVANSAGAQFDPPWEEEVTFQTLTITRNQTDYNPKKTVKYKSAFNDDSFFGFDAGQVKCKSITAKKAFDKGRSYWKVAYHFEIRDSWDKEFLDAGFWEIVNGKKKEITLKNGRPVPAPWPLDGNGQRLPEAQVQAGQGLKYRKFRRKSRQSFAALSLP